ncbi:MAG: histidine--tRNA ligase [Abitibacteriaceae bacterium]|nr:histidine--tRNA ligase [Abditibacteriaceae bacterium]
MSLRLTGIAVGTGTMETESNLKQLVEPETLKGFQDLLPENMIARNAIIDKIRKVYEKYGFVPIDTPTLEYLTTLVGTGGEEVNKQLFKLESPEGDPIALRFDLTVPFARLIAQYPEKLKLPFRRYHLGPVFRADKPDPGRFRQFTQFDIDIAGSGSIMADAEIVATMCEVLRSIGLAGSGADGQVATPEFQVRINNRKLVDALLEGSGITEQETQKHVLRVVDKLQKIGLDSVRAELGAGRTDESGDKIRGVGLAPDVIDRILAFISVTGATREALIAAVAEVLPASAHTETALQEMQELATALKCLGVGEQEAIFDPSLARGLDYYTGPVFEAFLPSAPQFGSIMGGGRYDQLVERFMENAIPATGASIGLDRLIAALTHLGKIEVVPTTTKVLVLAMRGIPATELLAIATELRAQDIPTEVFMGETNTSVRKQFAFANAKGIPVAVMLGEDELSSGHISVKNLEVGMQSRANIQDHSEYHKAGRTGQATVERSQLVQAVKEML